jgi:sugar lactone lactonase YvrE
MRRLRRATAAILATALCGLAAAAANAAPTVVATGLDNPRGLAFGADGTLYVAEAGRGGTGPCFTNSEPTFVCFGTTGAITQVRHGAQSRLVTGLPSLAAAGGGGATGPNDVSLLGNGAIAVTLGLGAPPATVASGGLLAGTGLGSVIRLNGHSGQWRSLADVAAYESSVNPDGTDLDTNPYGLLTLPGRTIVADAGGNSVLEVSASGRISTLAAFPQTPFTQPFPGSMDAVPTAIAQGLDGALYVGQLTGFPFPVGGSTVWRIGPAGLEPFRTGFTNVVDITFGPDGSLYVVEIDSAGLATQPPHPPIGSLIRVMPDGTRSIVAAGLFAPGGVAFGPDGAPYVTVCSVCAGGGQVLRLG